MIRRMFWMGKLTYKSFMSSVIILWFSLIWMLLNSCATSCEFSVMYVFGKSLLGFEVFCSEIWQFCMTVLVCYLPQVVEVRSVCVFYVCFIFIKYLCLLFPTSVLHCCSVCWICFWKRSVGSLFRGLMWFSCINSTVFCSNATLLIMTMALFLSALAIVKLLFQKMCLIWLRLYWYFLCRVLWVDSVPSSTGNHTPAQQGKSDLTF